MTGPTLYKRSNPDYSGGEGPARLNNLYEMAEAILVRLSTVAMGAGVVLPDRQVIYPAQVPVDCAQVSILLQGWGPHTISEGFTSCQTFKWAGNFQVAITRCTPGGPDKRGKLPGAAVMNEAGRLASQDAGLLQGLVATFEEIGPEMTLIIGSPEGGFQTTELTVALTAFGSLD